MPAKGSTMQLQADTATASPRQVRKLVPVPTGVAPAGQPTTAPRVARTPQRLAAFL